jgi:hypothetical protein
VRHLAARVHARVEREPAEQRLRAAAGGRVDRLRVDLDREAAKEPDANHEIQRNAARGRQTMP